MVIERLISGRYQIGGVIGRCGTRPVYEAHDNVVDRAIALKTFGDVQGRAALDLFFNECRALANLHHPNVVEIFDTGEFVDESVATPFFVMPLLIGMTLQQMMGSLDYPLAPERLGEIVSQACRGLQALHEASLVHRALKPDSIFVTDLELVKLIDFGMAHLVYSEAATSPYATISYFAPEQIEREECTPASDIFALGVVCYEALTGARPFTGKKAEDICDAILHQIPKPLHEVNPAVSQLVSRVIHKALAKRPQNRYESALEFAETLQKALRSEAIPALDPARIQPRIDRAQRDLEVGKYQMAADIVNDLEAAGHIDTALAPLRNQIDQALLRQRIQEILERAQMALEDEEFALGLQNIATVLKMDPANQPAIELREKIQGETTRREIDELLCTAQEAINGYAFARARQLLGNSLQLLPANDQVAAMLRDVEARELAYKAARQQKEELFQSAKEAWHNLEFATATAKLVRVLALERRAPDTGTPEGGTNYQDFLDLVRSAQIAIESAQKEVQACVRRGEYDRAGAIADEYIVRYPGHPIPQALKLSSASKQKRNQIARMAEIGDDVANQPELEKQLDALQSARTMFPNQPMFAQWMEPIRDQLDLANAVIAKARAHEERRQFEEALEQWRALRSIDPKRPELEKEINRINLLAANGPVSSWASKMSLPESASAGAALIVEPHTTLPSPHQVALARIRELGANSHAFITTTWGRARVGMVHSPQPLPVSRTQRWIAGTALALIAAALLFLGLRDRAPQPSQVQVTLSPGTLGAEIRLEKSRNTPGKNLQVQLAPGNYRVEESLDGYDRYTGTLLVGTGSGNRVLPALQPLPAGLHIVADLQKATVQFDQRRPAKLDDAGLVIEDILRGRHTLFIHDSKSEAHVKFATDDGRAPVLDGPVAAKELVAFVVTAMGSGVSINGSPRFKAAIDGGVPEVVPPQGYRFTGIPSGLHTLDVGDGKQFTIETGVRPAVWVQIYSDRNVGALQIRTNLDQFNVLLDGKPYERLIRDQSMLITNLDAKSYKVRVEADEYGTPSERDVAVKKGGVTSPLFTLAPIPLQATLAPHDVPPGTQVVVDNTLLGRVDQGPFKVDPGEHTVELRNSQYKSTPFRRTFGRGDSVPITTGDAKLERIVAATTTSASEVTLPDTRRAVANAEPPPKKNCVLADLAKTGWTQSRGIYVANSGASFPCSDVAGTYMFTIQLPQHGRVEWDLTGGGKLMLDKKVFMAQGGSRIDITDFRPKDRITVKVIAGNGLVIHEIRNGARWERVSTVAAKSKLTFSKDSRIVGFSFSE